MRLHNYKYEELKQEVADLLETYSIKTYPIDLNKLALKMNVSLIEYSSFENEVAKFSAFKSDDSFLAVINHKPYILFNDSQCETRKRFSIAHEFAHIWLEHDEDSEENEAEANFFASYLLAPVPMIDKYGLENFLDVSIWFNISLDAGFYAFSRFLKWQQTFKPKTEYEHTIVNLCSMETG